jgi:peptidoglycan/LPS O-acetylase OafA/YrhL
MLRGVAILLVLGHHAPGGVEGLGWPPPRLVRAWFDGGWMGVDLFFVLSGFLVSGLLFKEYKRHGDVWLGRFLVRRGFKIYPAFYTLLLATTFVAVVSGQAFSWVALICEALFVQNYGPSLGDQTEMFAHTWSLAVEEHFYLLVCIFFWLRLRRRHERPFAPLPWLFVLVAATCLGLRLGTSWNAPLPYDNKALHFPTHLRLDSLLFGVLLSYWYHFHQDAMARRVQGHKLLLLVAGVALLIPCFLVDIQQSFYVHTYGLTLNYLGFGGILLAALYWQGGRSRWVGRACALLAAIGFYSYSIYLWHLVLRQWSMQALLVVHGGRRSPYLVELAVFLAAALIGGALMAKAIETPFLRLRDRWFPSRSLPMDGAPNKTEQRFALQ